MLTDRLLGARGGTVLCAIKCEHLALDLSRPLPAPSLTVGLLSLEDPKLPLARASQSASPARGVVRGLQGAPQGYKGLHESSQGYKGATWGHHWGYKGACLRRIEVPQKGFLPSSG